MIKSFLQLNRWSFLSGLLLLLSTGHSWAQFGPNPFSEIVLAARQETYAPLSGGTAVAAVQANEGISGALPIGFDFKFAGSSYNTAYASSNGFLSFNSLLSADPTNDLSNANFNFNYDSAPLLAPLWDDLDGATGTASYRTTGAAGSRVFTFEWSNWKWGTTATGANISFQVRLYEGTNQIEYAYQNVGNPAPAVTGNGASFGFTTGNYFAALNSTGANPAIDRANPHNNITTPPATGQVYAFTPPTPPANDECANAALLTVAPANDRCANAYNTSNRYATPSGAGIPNSCIGGSDTWFRFVAPATGNVRLLVSAGNADLEVFSGTCGSLTSRDCGGNGNGREVTGLVPGATHYLRISVAQNFETEPYSICVSALNAAPTMTNDECASAVLVTAGSACQEIAGNLSSATASTGVADPTCIPWFAAPVIDVWYRTVVPASGTVYAQTNMGTAVGGLNGLGLTVYSGTCGTLNELGCNESNGSGQYGRVLVSNLTPGETLYLRVWLRSGYTGGTFGLCITDNNAIDLVVNTLNAFIDANSGDYRTITVTGTGSATLADNVTVTSALLVQDGGELILRNYTVGGAGSFTVQSGANLSLYNSAGLSASGLTGAVRVAGLRSFSTDANYTYRVDPGYVTGSGLPATVRNLYVNTDVDANPDAFIFPGPGDLTLTAPLSVRQRLRLKRNLITSSTNLLTLLSTPTQGSALIFNDAAEGFFAPDPAGVVNGPIRALRPINSGFNPGLGYRHYSAPVAGSTVADLATTGFAPAVNPAYNTSATPGTLTPFPTVYRYDEANVAVSPATAYSEFDKGWLSPSTTADALTVGRGYTVHIGGSEVVDFVGTPNSGSYPMSLSRGTAGDGWHLLGNPYPAPIDWRLASIPANMGAAAYVFESTGPYAGQYRTYVNGFGNPIIPMGQGFFVQQMGAAGSTANFSFTDAMRQTTFATGTDFRRGSAEQRPSVKLYLQGGTATADETTIYFEAGATAAIDQTFDAPKLQNPGYSATLASLTAAGTKLSVNGLPLLTSTEVRVPLYVAVPQAGTYTLAVGQFLNFAATDQVTLLDQQSNISYDLRRTARLTVNLTSGSAGTRFVLVFGVAAATGTRAGALAAQLQVYPNPAHTTLSLRLPAQAGTGAIQAALLNTLGQSVRTQVLTAAASGFQAEFDVRSLAAGVYTLRLTATSGETTIRKIVVE